MRTVRIAIVGGGLGGLYAARLLERRGIHDYVLLEGRGRLGGRIASFGKAGGSRFDLGPAWYWPEFQHELDKVINDLGIPAFPQYEDGDMMVERAAGEPPLRVPRYLDSPLSMRLVDGMESLVEALRGALGPARIATGRVVCAVRAGAHHVELDSVDEAGSVDTWQAGHVLLAVPPRLALDTIVFEPPLPPALARQWRGTATWMAAHAKYVAVYDRPFWRERGLSGEARSVVGPLGEIHDAGMVGCGAALFGFFRLSAAARAGVDDAALRAQCRAQLARLFGAAAAAPRAETIKDWTRAAFTATAQDMVPGSHDGLAPAAIASAGPWSGRLTGIASEWSPRFSGYLAGAVDAATIGVGALLGPAPASASSQSRNAVSLGRLADSGR